MKWLSKNRKGKLLEIGLFVALALALCFAVWQVFLKEDKATVPTGSEEEIRLVAILESIAGVGDAEVMIGVYENGERGVVIVCEGAENISVLMDVREAAAAALGIEQKYVKVYLKK
jgi:hypothetical protein